MLIPKMATAVFDESFGKFEIVLGMLSRSHAFPDLFVSHQEAVMSVTTYMNMDKAR
jgi:hypothetical protein